MSDVYIFGAKRTPIGSFQGQLSTLKGWQIGAHLLKSFYAQTKIKPDEVIMGCVLSAGQGQAPARQAVVHGYGDHAIPATTINKVCGSGMRSVMFAFDHIRLNPDACLVAGGFESMSTAPYLLQKARSGFRMGHGSIYDHMMLDGLEDAYEQGLHDKRRAMGTFADETAQAYGFSRQDQENYVTEGLAAYQKAQETGMLANEILPLTWTDDKGTTVVIEHDEPPLRVKPEKFSFLKPAFSKEGTVTAATSSAIADGAAVLLLAASNASLPITPLTKIVGVASCALAPEKFTLGPIYAVEKLLKKINWTLQEVDLFEINEAFAVVPMAFMKHHDVPREKMNQFGGACTLGHPIGASGARVLVTLINALKAGGLKKGVASVCIGGGEGVAVALEIV